MIFSGFMFLNGLYFVNAKNFEISRHLPASTEPMHIPKVFHTIWINFGKGEEVFPKYLKNMENLINLHPGRELKLWREYEIIPLIKEHCSWFLDTFQNYDKPIKKHDAARIIILYAFGGVYLDQDFIPLKNIEPMLKGCKFVVGNETVHDFVPVNGFLGSIKEFDFLKKVLEAMNKPGVLRQPVLLATGPALLKKVMLAYANTSDTTGMKVYGNEFLYPVSWANKRSLKEMGLERLKYRFPNSFLVQEYDASWM
jgi:mannosyltransferase OCH1-like enzyme